MQVSACSSFLNCIIVASSPRMFTVASKMTRIVEDLAEPTIWQTLSGGSWLPHASPLGMRTSSGSAAEAYGLSKKSTIVYNICGMLDLPLMASVARNPNIHGASWNLTVSPCCGASGTYWIPSACVHDVSKL